MKFQKMKFSFRIWVPVQVCYRGQHLGQLQIDGFQKLLPIFHYNFPYRKIMMVGTGEVRQQILFQKTFGRSVLD